jgi:uncharacterized membrane protein
MTDLVLSKIFYLFCHQIPARSPHFQGTTFPVCYRCAGLYGGILIGYLFLAMRGRSWTFAGRGGALAAATPLAVFLVDAWANGLGIWNSPGWWRALTGFGGGLSIPVILLPLAGQGGSRLSLPKSFAEWFWPAAAGAGFVWLLNHPQTPLVFRLMALACAFGWAGCLVNLSVALREYAYERRCHARAR